MGRKNKQFSKTLHQQAYDRLTEMQAFGSSKKVAVGVGADRDKIFSFSTYKTYMKHVNYFLRWVKETHPECTTLKTAKKYVRPWLELRLTQTDKNGNRLSPYTIHTEAAALAKLFQITPNDPDRFIPPRRSRYEIKRSRIPVSNDKHFSVTNNDELIRFCKGTGCRRNVLQRLEGRDLWPRSQMEREVENLEQSTCLSSNEAKHLSALKDALNMFPDQKWFIHHRRDKGGRNRFAPIIGPDAQMIISRMQQTKMNEKVWLHINTHADIHSYRAEYASLIYKQAARPIADIPFDRINRGSGKRFQSDVYVCRRDEQQKKLDRRALRITSKALGHNRVSVVAGNYLHGL